MDFETRWTALNTKAGTFTEGDRALAHLFYISGARDTLSAQLEHMQQRLIDIEPPSADKDENEE